MVEWYHPEALAEYVEAAKHYEEQQVGQAQKFTEKVDERIQFLLRFPFAGVTVGRRGLRRAVIHGFPFSLIYAIQNETLQVFALAHQSRRPGYWTHRL